MADEEQPVTPDNVNEWLASKFIEYAEISAEEFDAAQPFTRYGLDSFGAMTFAADLEDELGFEIETRTIWDNPTVEGLGKVLRAELESRAGEE